jgi:hypothetical protein
MKHRLNTDLIFKDRAAWVVEWHLPLYNSLISGSELRPYILPHRWKPERVFDFMRCLWWNSALWTPSEMLRRINEPRPDKKNPASILQICEGAWLAYGVHGESHFLIAGLTKNLCISRNKTGGFVLKWTRPAGARRNDKSGLVKPACSPVEREWEWKNPFYHD